MMQSSGRKENVLVTRENFIRNSGKRKVNWSESRGLNIHTYGKLVFLHFFCRRDKFFVCFEIWNYSSVIFPVKNNIFQLGKLNFPCIFSMFSQESSWRKWNVNFLILEGKHETHDFYWMNKQDMSCVCKHDIPLDLHSNNFSYIYN